MLMYLHGSHNKNYVYMWCLLHYMIHISSSPSYSRVNGVVCNFLSDILSFISYTHNGNCLYFSSFHALKPLFTQANEWKCFHVFTYLTGHQRGGKSGKRTTESDERKAAGVTCPLPRHVLLKCTTKRRPDDDWAVDVRRGFSKGGRKFLPYSFFLFPHHALIWIRQKGMRLRVENYVFILLPKKEKRFFLYHSTHDFPALFSLIFLCILSDPPSRKKNISWMKHSRTGDGILLLAHMMGVCWMCSWIICRIMWFKFT